MSSKKETGVKKLVTVLAASTAVTVTREEEVKDAEDGKNPKSKLAQIQCIRYPINIKKKFVSALFDSSSEINTIHPTFTKELGLFIRPTYVGAQKIDSITLDSYGTVVAAFSVKNKVNQVRSFKETFLIANITPEIVFGMSFLTLSSADVDFLGCEL